MSRRFEQTDGREAIVAVIPACDLCNMLNVPPHPAEFDGKTRMGPWANMCANHFREYGVGLGVGRGQKLFTEDI